MREPSTLCSRFSFSRFFPLEKKISRLTPTPNISVALQHLSLLEKDISVRRTSLVGIFRDLMGFQDGKDKGKREGRMQDHDDMNVDNVTLFGWLIWGLVF
jgi:hypothetical protein